MAETIMVYFEPLGSSGGAPYHETLVYTNSAGESFLATSYASNDRPTGSLIGNISAASFAVGSGISSPFGTLVTQWGTMNALSPLEIRHWLGPSDHPYASQTLLTGDDRSQQWSKVTDAYSQIGQQGLAYSPATQNSNSVASTG